MNSVHCFHCLDVDLRVGKGCVENQATQAADAVEAAVETCFSFFYPQPIPLGKARKTTPTPQPPDHHHLIPGEEGGGEVEVAGSPKSAQPAQGRVESHLRDDENVAGTDLLL